MLLFHFLSSSLHVWIIYLKPRLLAADPNPAFQVDTHDAGRLKREMLKAHVVRLQRAKGQFKEN